MKQHSLDEMARLNNDLANTQRVLMKQNAEIINLNERLQIMNTALEEFTYVASHDLREPLRMITGFTGLLKKKYGDQLDEKANLYMDFAVDGGTRMVAMIEDLLELARTGIHRDVKVHVDLNDAVQEVKANLFSSIKEKGATIILSNKLPVVFAYRSDMLRIFQNLVSNAIKFRDKEREPMIYIGAEEREKEWLFSIRDNGMGFADENIQNIFEVFTRLNSKDEFEGTGIGLAICKKITAQYDGRIWCESDIGKGTVFYFTMAHENLNAFSADLSNVHLEAGR